MKEPIDIKDRKGLIRIYPAGPLPGRTTRVVQIIVGLGTDNVGFLVHDEFNGKLMVCVASFDADVSDLADATTIIDRHKAAVCAAVREMFDDFTK